jgi:hypothetical protein
MITYRIEMVLNAINETKARARDTAERGELKEYKEAMESVLVLEATLVGEAEQLVDAIKKAA